MDEIFFDLHAALAAGWLLVVINITSQGEHFYLLAVFFYICMHIENGWLCTCQHTNIQNTVIGRERKRKCRQQVSLNTCKFNL